MLMRISTPTYEFCLLLVVPFLLVRPKLSVHSLACDESSHISGRNRMSDERLASGCQDLHSYTFIMTLTLMFANLYILCNQTQEDDVPWVYPLRVESKKTVQRSRNYNVQPRLVGGCMGEK